MCRSFSADAYSLLEKRIGCERLLPLPVALGIGALCRSGICAVIGPTSVLVVLHLQWRRIDGLLLGCRLYGNRQGFGVSRFDLITFGNQLELLWVSHFQFRCALRPFQSDRLRCWVKGDHVADDG